MYRKLVVLALAAILAACSHDSPIVGPEVEDTVSGYGDSLFASLEVRNEAGALVENDTRVTDGTYTFRFRCAGERNGALTFCLFIASWRGCGTASEFCFSLAIPFSEALGKPYQAGDTVEFEFSSPFGGTGVWRMNTTALGDRGYGQHRLNIEVAASGSSAVSGGITNSQASPGAVSVYLNGRFIRRISR